MYPRGSISWWEQSDALNLSAMLSLENYGGARSAARKNDHRPWGQINCSASLAAAACRRDGASTLADVCHGFNGFDAQECLMRTPTSAINRYVMPVSF